MSLPLQEDESYELEEERKSDTSPARFHEYHDELSIELESEEGIDG